MTDFMKKPCQHCPYRHDVKPFLRNERAEELAYHAQNPYASFPCHKTTESVEDDDGEERIETADSKVCAGFLTLQHNENGETSYDSDGFIPSTELVYSDAWEMIDAYAEENNKLCRN
jgi:hypothetical protein